jgi:hypothetical protein
MLWTSPDGQVEIWLGKLNSVLTIVRVRVPESFVRGQYMNISSHGSIEIGDNLYQFSQQMNALVHAVFGDVKLFELPLYTDKPIDILPGTVGVSKIPDFVNKKVEYKLIGVMTAREQDIHWEDVTRPIGLLNSGG